MDIKNNWIQLNYFHVTQTACLYISYICDYRSAVELFETYSMGAMTFNPPVESLNSKRKVCDTFHHFF